MNKDHPEIPTGSYCYRSLKVIESSNGQPHIKMEMCPHWHKTENGASCDLIKEEHTKMCMYHLLWDQVKECGINKHKTGTEPPVCDGIDTSNWIPRQTICNCGKSIEILVKPKNK